MSDTAGPTDSATIARLTSARIIAKGAGIALIGLVAYRGFNYVFEVIIAREVGASSYGLFVEGLAAINLIVLFALLGLDRGVLRYVARFRALGDKSSEVWLARLLLLFVAGWAIVLGVIVALGADAIASLYGPGNTTMASLLRWFVAPVIPLAALVFLLSALADGQKKVELGVLFRDILQPAVALMLASLLLLLHAALPGVVISYIISMVLAVAVALFLLRAYFTRSNPPIGRPTNLSLREVLLFSLPFLPMILFRRLSNQLEIYLLGFLGNPTDVGIFRAAANTALLVSFGLNAAWRIYSAVAAELHAKGDIQELEHALQLTARWSVTISLPAVIAIALFGREILGVYGSHFTAGVTVLFILTLGQFVNAVTGPIGVTLSMAGYPSFIAINNAFALVLNIALDWWLITEYGLIGAAVGSAVTIITTNLIWTVAARALLGIRSYNTAILRILLAGLLTLGITRAATIVLQDLPSVTQFLIGLLVLAVVYCVFILILAPADDRRLLIDAWARIRRLVPVTIFR